MKLEVFKRRFFENAPRYRWLDTLGRGGVGVVFKALDLELDEVVAIKVLQPNVDRDEQALLLRFKREIHLNRKIKHPSVARMYDYGVSGDFPYITMEYVRGKDLWTIVDERGALHPAEAVPILRQIARGCAAVHRLGIVHRDLKSQNVIVDDYGAVVILDFGLARGEGDGDLTLASTLLGTPHYMSPEQALGKPLDLRSDIYSIGVIGFEMLTGTVPFSGDSPVAVAMQHVTDPIPAHLLHRPEVSEELRGILLRTLEKERENRFQTATDLETALALLEHAPLPPRDESLPREPWRDPSRQGPDSDALAAELEEALNSIVLPPRAERPPSSRGAAGEAGGEAERAEPVVLVVSDDVQELVRQATQVCRVGCRTIEVRSGPEALEALTHQPVDVVLMDVALPGLDGFDVTRIVKSQPALAPIPVLLVASHPDRGQFAFAIQSGAADLLPKPIPQAVLEPRLWQILSHRGFTPPKREDAAPRAEGSRSRPSRRSSDP